MAEVFFRQRAIKGFKSASAQEKSKIKSVVEILRKSSFPPHTKKLGGHDSGYRIRIGKWRMLFVLNHNEIDIVDIFIKKGESDYQRRG